MHDQWRTFHYWPRTDSVNQGRLFFIYLFNARHGLKGSNYFNYSKLIRISLSPSIPFFYESEPYRYAHIHAPIFYCI